MSEPCLDESARWYCLRTQIKREHIATAQLAKEAGVDVFCPRVRFQRLTRRGKVWFNEAMFPNYLFARFDWQHQLRQVQAVQGVARVLRFGEYSPEIAPQIIADLRASLDESDLKVFLDPLEIGDEITITEGPMMGLTAVITRLMPSRDRVKVLLEFLGQPTETDMAVTDVYKETQLKAG